MFVRSGKGPGVPPRCQTQAPALRAVGVGAQEEGCSTEACILARLLELPFSESADTCLSHFCRLKSLVLPRRARAIFDVLVKAGLAKDFTQAREIVKNYVRDFLDLPF